MIALTTAEFDPNGWVLIAAHPRNLYAGARRGSVTATFDGVSHYDTGYFPEDQTLVLSVERPTKSLLDQLVYLVSHYQRLDLSCETGFYRCTLSYALNNATLGIQIRILARLA